MEFPRQEYWSRLPFPPPVDLPDPGIKTTSPCISCIAGGLFTSEPRGKPHASDPMPCYALTSSCPLLPLPGPQVPSQCPWLYSSPQTGLSVCVVLITILLEIGYSASFNTCFEIVSAILIHLPFSLYFRNNFFIFKKSSRDFDQNYLKSIGLFGEELILLH